MSHNTQVKANIKQIKADVEAATSQDHLLNVIDSVQHHSGPLDYNDQLPTTLMWVLFAMGAVGMMMNYMIDGNYSTVGAVMYYAMHYSAIWVPGGIAFLMSQKFSKQGKLPMLKPPLDRLWVMPAIIGVAVGLLAFIPMWFQGYWFLMGNLTVIITNQGQFYYPLEVTTVALILAAILYYWLRKRKYWRDPVSDRIHMRDILLNNNLTEQKVKPESKASELESKFREFDRGNHRREIKSMYSGEYQGEVHQFAFQLYHFHYVDKRTETYQDSEGNTKTRSRYDHFDRYGVLLNFPFTKSVSLDSDPRISFPGKKYTTASNAFNRMFKVRTQDEMQAARLLSPAVVEALSKFGNDYKRSVIEIIGNSDMCIAFEDKDLLSLRRRFGLDKPDAFKEEIAGHAKLDKLDALLATIHNLMRLSDNNFA